MVADDLRTAWKQDDMLAWIMFLLFILPMPFMYAYLQNVMPDRSALMHTVWTVVLTTGLWAGLYTLKQKLESSEEESVDGSHKVVD